MRSVIIAVAVVILLVVGVSLGSAYVNYWTDSVVQELEQLYDAAVAGSWDTALAKAAQTHSMWKSKCRVFTVIYDHKELENIDSSMAKIEQYAAFNDSKKCAVEIANAIDLVRRLPRKDAMTYTNIL